MKFILSLLLVFNFVSMKLSFSQLKEIKTDSALESLEMEPLSQETINTVWDNMEIKSSSQCRATLRIENYAINESGQIAILFREHINIYDENYTFKCSFTYDAYGNEYIDWNKDNIILITRSEKAICFDDKGNMINIEQIVNNRSVNRKYYKYLRSETKNIGKVTYELRKKPLISQTLVAIDENGEEHVIYQSSIWFAICHILIVICIISIFIGGIIVITYESIKKSKKMCSNTIFIPPSVQG